MIYAAYIILTLIINAVFAVIFDKALNISFVPLFIIGFMIFNSIYLYYNREKDGFNVNNFSEITDKEWRTVSLYMSRSFFVLIPFNFPLVFFFNIYVKIIAMVFIVTLAYIGGPIFFKIKNKNR